MNIYDLKSNLKKLEDDLPKIKYVKKKIIQALRIREKLVKQRDEAINNIYRMLKGSTEYEEKDLEKQIALLKRTLKNEKNFMEVVERGIKATYIMMEDVYAEQKKIGMKRVVLKNIKKIINFMKLSEKLLHKAEKRIILEEKFIDSKDLKDLLKFNKQWEREIRYNQKLIKKINPGDVSKIKIFLESLMDPTIMMSYIGLGGLGAGLIGSIVQDAKDPMELKMKLGLAGMAVLIAAMPTLAAIFKSEEEISRWQSIAFDRLKKEEFAIV